jgi:hypothetical protein
MNEVVGIVHFMERARVDPRIGPLHISLYMAIIFYWVEQGWPERVTVTARELMPVAKIAGGTPFYRCIKQLHAYGYIGYEPSFNPKVKSGVILKGVGEVPGKSFGSNVQDSKQA